MYIYRDIILVTAMVCIIQDFNVAACINNCKRCEFHNNICDECESGFFLDSAMCTRCSSHCRTCSGAEGCTTCNLLFWGLHCNESCPSNCNPALGCNRYTGYCVGCQDEFYGPECTEPCSRCLLENCELRNCRNGCKDGYVLQTNNYDYSSCQACPENCLQCLNTTECIECNVGYELYMSIDGFKICKSSDCINDPYCTYCNYINNKLVCLTCLDGYYLSEGRCVKCSSGCKSSCDQNGLFIDGCKVGYTGSACGYTCRGNCLKCSQNNQILCESCKGAYYTNNCTVPCNKNFVPGDPSCSFDSGYCLNGCYVGYWGNQCENSCSEQCVKSNTVCLQNGTCIHRCIQGFVGHNCSQTTTPSTEVTSLITSTLKTSNTQPGHKVTSTFNGTHSKVEQADKSVIAAAIGGVAGGVVILVILLVVIICFIKRRKQKGRDRPSLAGEVINSVYEAEILTERKSQQSTSQPQDYIYAQPNKPKNHLKNEYSMEDTDIKKKTSINTETNVDEESEEEIKSEDTGQLENLDDGDVDIIVAEAVAPTSDTYYNTEGLKRSRIQVSKLLDYVKVKGDFLTEFERLPKTLTRPCNEALKPHNRAKNRYNGIYSYDATRVVVKGKGYINASYNEGYDNSRAYIASLGPTKSTMPQFAVFWEMVWQENTQKIVMLTNLMESGIIKCDQYWPDDGSSRQYGSISVTAKAEHVFAEFVVRELIVVKAGEIRTVTQYHYTAWPDKSVPDTVVSLLEFKNTVEKKNTPKAGAMIVHCSAGIGRTGTYIALDTLVKEGKAENSVDIFGCVNALLGQRVHMVQNVDQYEFLHHSVVYALSCQPEPCDASSLISFTTDDRMNDQFQAFTNLRPLLTNKESDAIAANFKRKENRKESDIPGNHHRVNLTGVKKDYINAVFVDGYQQKDRYILAQTPMPSTLEDFVSLLYQERVGLVVCLDEENTKDKTIGQYIAPANKIAKFGHFHLSADSSECHEAFVVRTLKISKLGTSTYDDLKVQHYQFQGWKHTETNSVPESVQAFMSLNSAVTKHCRPGSGTILFHCLCVREHLETSEAKTYYNIL